MKVFKSYIQLVVVLVIIMHYLIKKFALYINLSTYVYQLVKHYLNGLKKKSL